MGEPILNATKIDAIGEIHNISMGSAAIAISNMISSTVDITTPHVRVCKAQEVAVDKLSDEVSGILFNEGEDSVFVKINYISGITGTSVLVLNPKDVQVIVQKLMGMPADPTADFTFDEMSLSAISEVMNQMMGASATAMSQMLGTPIDISPPETRVSQDKNLLFELQGVSPDDNVCAVAFDLKIDDDINSKFVTLLTIELANSMVSKMFQENIGEGAEEAAASGASAGGPPALDSMQCDAIGELQNMMMGAGATALSNFINGKVWITTPHVSVAKAGEVNFDDLEPSICVKIDFVKGIHGSSILVLKQSDVQLIINKLMGMPMVVDENFVFDEMSMSAVCEIMNQMMGASATTLSEVMNTATDISTPEAMTVETAEDILKLNGIAKDDTVCAVTFDLTIDDVINSHFATMLSLDLANKMADSMLGGYGGEIEFEPEPDISPTAAPAPAPTAASAPAPTQAPKPAPKPAPAPAPAPKKSAPKPKAESRVAPSSAQVQSYDMGSFDDDEEYLTREQYTNLKPLLDVPMEVSVRIGTTQKRIEEVSDFTKGTIIELDAMANEPVDIMVNGNLMARGEVVVVDDNFAVRITEIVK